MLRKGIALAAFGLALVNAPSALAAGGAAPLEHVEFSFEGPLGQFDQAQLQRGYKVYREVCSACHSMNLMSFRNLGQKGGPFYVEGVGPSDNPYVKSIAAEYQINDIDSETGDVIQRPGTSADKFPAPFPNDAAARASNGGALPPDLSVMAKARHHGPHYIYSLLGHGYVDPPAGLHVNPGQHYNKFFPGDLTSSWSGDPKHVPPGGVLAMPPPLADGKVTFDDGTKSTVDQQAKDVAAFIAWASEPKMEERKSFGLAAMAYLVIFAGLLYWSYRRIWRNVAH